MAVQLIPGTAVIGWLPQVPSRLSLLCEEQKKKKTSVSSGRWDQGEMCSMCSILWTCLLSKLAQLSVSTFWKRASSASPWCFQTIPAKVQNDLFHCTLFKTSDVTHYNCFPKLHSLRYCIPCLYV